MNNRQIPPPRSYCSIFESVHCIQKRARELLTDPIIVPRIPLGPDDTSAYHIARKEFLAGKLHYLIDRQGLCFRLSDTQEYSEIYRDDKFEYRHVILPSKYQHRLLTTSPKKFLTEKEWRSLGIQQSPGWEHYLRHKPEPSIFLFRLSLRLPLFQVLNTNTRILHVLHHLGNDRLVETLRVCSII